MRMIVYDLFVYILMSSIKFEDRVLIQQLSCAQDGDCGESRGSAPWPQLMPVLHDPRWCYSRGTHVLVVCVGTPIILLLIPYPTPRELVHYILFYFMFQQKISDVQGHPQLRSKYEANPRYIRIFPKQKYHMIIYDISNNIKVEKPSAQRYVPGATSVINKSSGEMAWWCSGGMHSSGTEFKVYKTKVNVSVCGAECLLFQGPCTITVINLFNKICNRNKVTAHVKWVSLRHSTPCPKRFSKQANF